jgi:hypothetical protein
MRQEDLKRNVKSLRFMDLTKTDFKGQQNDLKGNPNALNGMSRWR